MILTEPRFYLYQLLIEYRKLCIPQIGTFRIVQSASKRSQKGDQLCPPVTEVSFEKDFDENFKLSLLLDECGIMPRSVAEQEEKKIVETYLSHQVHGTSYTIKGFGEISGDKFIPVNTEYFNTFTGLNEVYLPEIKSGSFSHIQEQHKVELNKPSRFSDLWMWILAALVLVFTITIFNQNRVILSRNEKINVPDSTHHHRSKTIEFNDSMQEKGIAGGNNNAINQIITPHSEETKESFGHDSERSGILNHAGGQCVIVVGSFKNAENVSEMRSRITSMGYEAFTLKNQDLTRVGVLFDCKAIAHDSFLTQIRQKIHPDAWFMQF